MSEEQTKWSRPASPPKPKFLGQAERNLVKQINDELIETVMPSAIVYYPISIEQTQFHSVYGEAIRKTFLSPIHVSCLVEWEGLETETGVFGIDKTSSIVVHFHKRRLVEDQNLFVREGDFVQYGDQLYEIVKLNEPKQIFGQVEHKMEISANCIKTRESVFNGK